MKRPPVVVKESSKILIKFFFWLIVGIIIAGLWFKFGILGGIIFKIISL